MITVLLSASTVATEPIFRAVDEPERKVNWLGAGDTAKGADPRDEGAQ